jgi:hypothetical protein
MLNSSLHTQTIRNESFLGRSEGQVRKCCGSVDRESDDRVFLVGHCVDTAVRVSSGVLFVTETDCVYRAVRTESLNLIQVDFRPSMASSNNQ